MKIRLVDIDSTGFPNYALAKIRKFHLDKGDDVELTGDTCYHFADITYVSCVFSWNRAKADWWSNVAKVGGSGYSLVSKLPPEIESVRPHINLGFTSRGCKNHCAFCIVNDKEGPFKPVGNLLDLWDGSAKDITILDNNILCDISHFRLICAQASDNNIRLDFNQGLDHRLLTQEAIDILKTIRHKDQYRFAFDHPGQIGSVESTIRLLAKNGVRRSMWYVLVGYNTTYQQDLDRLNFLRDNNQNVFVMRYNKHPGKEYIPLAQWGNMRFLFHKLTFAQWMSEDKQKKYQGYVYPLLHG